MQWADLLSRQDIRDILQIVQHLLYHFIKVCLPFELLISSLYLFTLLDMSPPPLSLCVTLYSVFAKIFLGFLGIYLLNLSIAIIILQWAVSSSFPSKEAQHQCSHCYTKNLVWRLEDELAIVLHGAIGWFLFQFLPLFLPLNIMLIGMGQILWRTYLYGQVSRSKEHRCPHSTLMVSLVSLQAGIGFVLIDVMLVWIRIPLTLYWSCMFLLDFTLIVALHAEMFPACLNVMMSLRWTPIQLSWWLSQLVVIGIAGLNSRGKQQTFVERALAIQSRGSEFWKKMRVCRRIMLWEEYQNLTALLHKGATAPYAREQLVGVLHTMISIRDTMTEYNIPIVAISTMTRVPLLGSWVWTLVDPKVGGLRALLYGVDTHLLLKRLNQNITYLDRLITYKPSLHIQSSEAVLVVTNYFPDT